MMVSGLTHISWQHKSQTQSLLMTAKSILSAAESSWWVPSPEPPRKPLILSLSNKPLIFLPLFKAAEKTLGEEAKVSLAVPLENLHNLTCSSHKLSG